MRRPPARAKADILVDLKPIPSHFLVASNPKAKNHKPLVLCDACDSLIPKGFILRNCCPLNVICLVYST